MLRTSALGGKAAANSGSAELPLMTLSGHSSGRPVDIAGELKRNKIQFIAKSEKHRAMADNCIQPHNEKPAASWASAGRAYEKFSEDLGDAINRCIDCLDPQPGERVLDVATGTGWGARLIAARGAEVHGIDFGKNLIDAARTLASEAELEIQFSTADAEDLPFDDASFDVVISTFGVMFVQRPEAAADELARVCRPGGRLGLTTWAT